MTRRRLLAGLAFGFLLFPAPGLTQISFPRPNYYVAMGDSYAAGDGALPMTHGYTYQLYQHGVFGSMTDTYFVNVGIKGARSWELRDHQVPLVLCSQSARPTVITITAGGIDFLSGDTNIPAIAQRVAQAVDLLLHNGTGIVTTPVLDPVTGDPCAPLSNVTILVSNYLRILHPVPQVAELLDKALAGFDYYLRQALLGVTVPAGSRLAVVDLYGASEGRTGLVLIDRRLGYEGPYDFNPHPTNLGHGFIAAQFEAAWKALQ